MTYLGIFIWDTESRNSVSQEGIELIEMVTVEEEVTVKGCVKKCKNASKNVTEIIHCG